MADSSSSRRVIRTTVETSVEHVPAQASSSASGVTIPTSPAPRLTIESAPMVQVERPTSEEQKPQEQEVAPEASPRQEVAVGASQGYSHPVTRVAIEDSDEHDEQHAAQDKEEQAAQAEHAQTQGASSEPKPTSFSDVRRSASGWVHQTFAGHEHAFWGAVIALTIALLVFLIGFWRVLFILVLVMVGIAVGQIFDGDPKLVRAIRDLLDGDRGRR